MVVVRSLDSAAAVRVDVVGRNLFRRSAYAVAESDGTPSRSLHLGFCSTYLNTPTQSEHHHSKQGERRWGAACA